MKIVAATALMREAADVLEPVRDDVVVFGAVAVEIALAGSAMSVTPTRDVDLVVETAHANAVVAQLEARGLRRSELAHEAAFTWVLGDLKVQLVRDFHPFPRGPAERLPVQPASFVARHVRHQERVAFADTPDVVRFHSVNAACVVALKRQAFGRSRADDDGVVRRDYSDVHLILARAGGAVLRAYASADPSVRVWVEQATDLLADDREAQARAADELVRSGLAASARSAMADVRRVATLFRRELHERHPAAQDRTRASGV